MFRFGPKDDNALLAYALGYLGESRSMGCPALRLLEAPVASQNACSVGGEERPCILDLTPDRPLLVAALRSPDTFRVTGEDGARASGYRWPRRAETSRSVSTAPMATRSRTFRRWIPSQESERLIDPFGRRATPKSS